jgi:hypothetical protein
VCDSTDGVLVIAITADKHVVCVRQFWHGLGIYEESLRTHREALVASDRPAETGLWTRTKVPFLEQADRRLGCLLKVLFATLSGLPRVLRRTNVATCGTLAGLQHKR